MKMNPLLECKVKKCIRSLLYGTLVSLLFTGGLFAQERTVSGTVTSGEDGSPVPGVNVIIKGTTTGTATDFDGKYTLKVPGAETTLVFSYIGFVTEEIQVGNRTVVDVVMSPDVTQLGEVVVTSLGIEKEKRQLTYSAQAVGTKELSVARETNVINSLAGKVAGMDLTKASGGVGTATRVTLRGIRSMGGNNQPLFIIDGVPVQGTTNSGPSNEGGGFQSPDGISNINPDDIASITILKGANAAALYGSRAQNGAIIITTKKGKKGGLGIDFSTNFSIENPMILTKYQYEYGQGSAGKYIKNSEFEWGPKLDGQMVEHWSPNPNYEGPETYRYVAHPDNLKDFFSTGWNWTNTVGINAGNDKSQAYISYTNTKSQGIVPNNRLNRNNFNLRFTSNLTDKLSVDAKVSYIQQTIENRVSTGDSFWNPMRALYRQPTNISLEDAQNYEYYDNAGNLLQHYWNPHSNGGENVYWMINRTGNHYSKDRVIALGSIKYEFVKGLTMQVRGAMDWNTTSSKYWAYNDTYTIADAGFLQYPTSNWREMNIDFLLSYTHQWGDTWSLDVSFGGNARNDIWNGLNVRVNRFLKPNLFTLTNTSQLIGSDSGGETKMNSLYAFATIGFKNYLYLELTGRNDWSSTLPPDNWSYFYPSAGLTWVISDMINTLPNWLSLAKIRASYAIVGNDTGWAQLEETFSFRAGGQLGYADKNTSIPAKELKPEETHSLEIGFDLRFWQDRLGIDFAWYKTNTFNQLIRVPRPFPSGASSILINAGNIQNKGYEFTINGTLIRNANFSWDMSFNYSHNQNDVIELTDELSEYTVRGRSWMTTIKVVEGMPYGMIFTKGFVRDESGNVMINQNGLPITTPGQTVPMGNYLPDWLGGFSTSFNWKNLLLTATVDMRFGGKIFSFTEANLASDGFSDYTLEGREGMVVQGVLADTVVYNGVEYLPGQQNPIEITSEDYWQSLGGRNTPTGEPFGYDASYVRLREIVLGYNFNFHSTGIKALNVSLYGRNLLFLYNASKVVDPNMSVGTGNYQGFEGFGLPTTRQYGISAKISF